MTAEERGLELFNTSYMDIPSLAIGFLDLTIQKLGICAETHLTSFIKYAQCIEQLECTNPLYQATEEDKQWFEVNKYRYSQE
ncbi:MAG: hypothetical protein ACXW2E_00585 [Nitrososphaeraceae archaeon]